MLQVVCKPVYETCYKDVCYTVCRNVTECITKDVCETCYKDCVETCYKDCVEYVCKPVTTCKTVTQKCGEWVDRAATAFPASASPLGRDLRMLLRSVHLQDDLLPQEGSRDLPSARPGLHARRSGMTATVCEQVPCTTYVKEKVCRKVPYTVCKKVPYTVVKKVPCTICRMVKENVVKKVPYTVCRTDQEVICQARCPTRSRKCFKRRLC